MEVRSVEAFDGVALESKVNRKGDINYFAGAGKKTGGKKQHTTDLANSTPPGGGRFNLSIGIIEECSAVDISPPLNAAEVTATITQLQTKLKYYRDNQQKETDKRIAKVMKEIDGIEAKAAAASLNTAPSTPGAINGSGAEKGVSKGMSRKTQGAEATKTESGDGFPQNGAREAAVESGAGGNDAVDDVKKARVEDGLAA